MPSLHGEIIDIKFDNDLCGEALDKELAVKTFDVRADIGQHEAFVTISAPNGDVVCVCVRVQDGQVLAYEQERMDKSFVIPEREWRHG